MFLSRYTHFRASIPTHILHTPFFAFFDFLSRFHSLSTTVDGFEIQLQVYTRLRPRLAIFGTQHQFLSPHNHSWAPTPFRADSPFSQLPPRVFTRSQLRSTIYVTLNIFPNVHSRFRDLPPISTPFHPFFTPFHHFWPFLVKFLSFWPVLLSFSSPISYITPSITVLATRRPFSSFTTQFSLIFALFHPPFQPFYHTPSNFQSYLTTSTIYCHSLRIYNHILLYTDLCDHFRANFSCFWPFLTVVLRVFIVC